MLVTVLIVAGVIPLIDYLLEKAEAPRPGMTLRLCNTRIADRSKDFIIFADSPQDFVQWVKALDSVKRSLESLRQRRVGKHSTRVNEGGCDLQCLFAVLESDRLEIEARSDPSTPTG
jgi:hypothetical protein